MLRRGLTDGYDLRVFGGFFIILVSLEEELIIWENYHY